MSTEKYRCHLCFWWRRSPNASHPDWMYGYCQYNPPIGIRRVWPETDQNDWCSKWKSNTERNEDV